MNINKPVCAKCGGNDLEVEVRVWYTVDKDGYVDDQVDADYMNWTKQYCKSCQLETKIISEKEFRAKNRNNKIDDILND